ncbi:hypothetical protein E4U21_001115 [Claviceps maximensis]|nr:hypothetical protein E4U21_001115 [Claviceps maximensis]
MVAILSKAALVATIVAFSDASPYPDGQHAAAATRQTPFVPDGYFVPAYYPAPYGGWTKDWQESYRKARALVDSMTLAEKTNITGGSGIYMVMMMNTAV